MLAVDAFRPIRLGAKVDLVVEGSGSKRRHLVMYASEQCPTSRMNVGLYRELARQASMAGDWDMSVLVDDRDAKTTSWLPLQRIEGVPVLRRDAWALGLWATPTLIILDGDTVTDILVGAITAGLEARLWKRLTDLQRTTPLRNVFDPKILAESEIAALVGPLPQVVDIRPRSAFEKGHRLGATNIQFRELSVLAPVRLSPALPIAVDCFPEVLGVCPLAANLLHSLGFADVSLIVPK